MKIEKTALSAYKTRLDVTADVTEVTYALDDGVPMFLARIHAQPLEGNEEPLEGLKKRLGEDQAPKALADAVMTYLLPVTIGHAKVEPLIAPEPKAEGTPRRGSSFSYSVEVYERPEMALTSFDPVQVTVTAKPVTKQAIDDQMLEVAKNFTKALTDPETGKTRMVTPAITDAWVRDVFPAPDVNTVAELKDRVRTVVELNNNQELESEKLNAAVSEFAARLSEPITEELVHAMSASKLSEYETQLASQGTSLDAFLAEQGVSRDAFLKQLNGLSEHQLAESIALDAVFHHIGEKLSDEDISRAMDAIATASGGDRDAARQELENMGRTPAIEQTARRIKAGEWIVEHAEVTVKEG